MAVVELRLFDVPPAPNPLIGRDLAELRDGFPSWVWLAHGTGDGTADMCCDACGLRVAVDDDDPTALLVVVAEHGRDECERYRARSYASLGLASPLACDHEPVRGLTLKGVANGR